MGLNVYHCSGAAEIMSSSASAIFCVARCISASRRIGDLDRIVVARLVEAVGQACGRRPARSRPGLRGQHGRPGGQRSPLAEESDGHAVGSVAPVDDQAQDGRLAQDR